MPKLSKKRKTSSAANGKEIQPSPSTSKTPKSDDNGNLLPTDNKVTKIVVTNQSSSEKSQSNTKKSQSNTKKSLSRKGVKKHNSSLHESSNIQADGKNNIGDEGVSLKSKEERNLDDNSSLSGESPKMNHVQPLDLVQRSKSHDSNSNVVTDTSNSSLDPPLNGNGISPNRKSKGEELDGYHDDDGCMSDGVSVEHPMSDDEGKMDDISPTSAAHNHSMSPHSSKSSTDERLENKKCEFCGVIKRSPADLKRHLTKHTGERPFVCLLCDFARAFKAKRSLQYHQFSVHGVEHKNISERYPDIRKRKLEAGELIDESVISELHKRGKFEEEESGSISDGEATSTGSHVIVNGFEPIKKRVCEICNKVCVKPSDLKRHMMSHTGERPFKCEVCGKPFRAKNSMMYHLKSSHGYDVELSPGLEERFLKLKRQNKLHKREGNVSKHQQLLTSLKSYIKPEVQYPTYPPLTQPLLIPTRYMTSTASVDNVHRQQNSGTHLANILYSNDSNSYPNNSPELDEASGLFSYEKNELKIPTSSQPQSNKTDSSTSLVNPGGSLIGKTITQISKGSKNVIHISNETVLVTRLDGVIQSGKKVSMYKCHLCGKLYNYLGNLRHHLLFHFDKEITTYHCDLCNSSFWFKIQIMQHIRKKHPADLSKAVDGCITANGEKSHDSTSDAPSCLDAPEITQSDSGIPRNDQSDSGTPEINQSDSGIVSDDNQSDQSSPGKEPVNVSVSNMKKRGNSQDLQTIQDCIHTFYHELTFSRNNKGVFDCMICHKTFSKEGRLLKHIKVHSNQNLCFCGICNQGFSNYDLLSLHMNHTHDVKCENSTSKDLEGGIEADYPRIFKGSEENNTSAAGRRGTLKQLELLKRFSENQNGEALTGILSQRASLNGTDLEENEGRGYSDRSPEKEHEARAFRERAGLAEDVTVVMPCDPEEQDEPENLSMPRLRNEFQTEDVKQKESFSDVALDFSKKKDNAVENETLDEYELGEIISAPKRTLLMDSKSTKSKRKSFQPTRLGRQTSATDSSIYNGNALSFLAEKAQERGQMKELKIETATPEPKISPAEIPSSKSSANEAETSLSDGSRPSALSMFNTTNAMAQYFQNSAQAQAQIIASSQFVNTLASLGGKAPNLASLTEALANPTAQALIATGQYSTLIQALASAGHLPIALAQAAAAHDLVLGSTDKVSPLEKLAQVASSALPSREAVTTNLPASKFSSPLSHSFPFQATAAAMNSKNKEKSPHTAQGGRSVSPTSNAEENAQVSTPESHISSRGVPTHPAFMFSSSPFMASYFSSMSKQGLPVTENLPPSESQDSNMMLSVSPRPPSNPGSDGSLTDEVGKMSSLSPGAESTSKDGLVGYPRVQWSPKSEMFQWHHITPDGRKVTSLSRTHSRLPIVNAPVDRDMICKPTTLDDGRQVFRCPFCSKDFLSFSDINRHMDFHEDIRPYKCKYCEYYARTNSQLKVHMMRHQGIREFCCRVCNYKGVTQSDLNRHMKSQIHMLKSRNECKYCGEGFVTGKNLEKHLDGNCIVKVQQERGDLLV